MIRANENARAANTGADTAETYTANDTPSEPEAIKTDLLSLISRRLWLLSYTIEEQRQQFAVSDKLMRQALACVALALLRLVGVRYV